MNHSAAIGVDNRPFQTHGTSIIVSLVRTLWPTVGAGILAMVVLGGLALDNDTKAGGPEGMPAASEVNNSASGKRPECAASVAIRLVGESNAGNPSSTNDGAVRGTEVDKAVPNPGGSQPPARALKTAMEYDTFTILIRLADEDKPSGSFLTDRFGVHPREAEKVVLNPVLSPLPESTPEAIMKCDTSSIRILPAAGSNEGDSPVATHLAMRSEDVEKAVPNSGMNQVPGSASEVIRAPEPLVSLDSGPVRSLKADIRCSPGDVPENIARAKFAEAAAIPEPANRDWLPFTYCWEAPSLCYGPLYFEETNLERYGYGPRYLRLFQPVLSAGHFFGTLPILPYEIAVQPPGDRKYTLGHYRPGSPAPYQLSRPPVRPLAGVAEAGVVTGLFFVIP